MLATVVEKAVQKEANAGNDLGESLFTAKPTPFFVEKTSSQLPPTLFALFLGAPLCTYPRSLDACHVMRGLLLKSQTAVRSMSVRSLSH
jgi:hypothetical protein